MRIPGALNPVQSVPNRNCKHGHRRARGQDKTRLTKLTSENDGTSTYSARTRCSTDSKNCRNCDARTRYELWYAGRGESRRRKMSGVGSITCCPSWNMMPSVIWRDSVSRCSDVAMTTGSAAVLGSELYDVVMRCLFSLPSAHRRSQPAFVSVCRRVH
jgi:hypothetical protein